MKSSLGISNFLEEISSLSPSIVFLYSIPYQASQVALMVKNPPASVRDTRDVGSIPGSGRLPGEGHGNPLQYSSLENPMDR